MFKVLFALFFSLRLFAAVNYYISPSGNDTTGNGSQGSPWATLSKALAAVPATLDASYVVNAAGGYIVRDYQKRIQEV
jgi:hypothetical protein